MPTFSPMQLDRLIESRAATTSSTSSTATTTTKTTLKNDNKNLPEDSFPKLERRNTTSSSPLRLKSSFQSSVDIPPSHPNIRRRNSISDPPHTVRPPLTPALYTTPEPTPLPLSPTSSFPPSSPFLINHKRRGPRLSKSFSEQNVALTENNAVEVERTRSLSEENVISELNLDKIEENNGDDVAVAVVLEKSVGEREVKGSESEDFYDPQESLSYSSLNEVDDFGGRCSSGGGDRSAKAITPMGEFYDAWEELSSDSGQQAAQRSLSDVETELREMRLSLLMEIEKRKHVEEAVQNMQSKWQMLREKLHSVGVALPANLAVLEGDGQSDVSLSEDICRQIHVARFVSESIGQGIARAEVEAEMEAQLEVKNFEIARLCDRLHYYETMNREMSQRNQEAVEIARRDRHKRRRRQKWVWGSIATAITLGSAALAWSYLPKGSPSTKTLEASKPGSDMN